ncbi:Cytochrome P450 [Mycena kentingensis (nom. inval.)]|nr:Cytochrome P450 [Mycena kentingensis (nom. inval.)]
MASSLSPIHTLPFELIAKIFIFAFASYYEPLKQSYYGSWTPIEGPCVPSQVCSYWRTVALKMPELWAGFWAYPITRAAKNEQVAICEDATRAFLARASPLPIDVSTQISRHGIALPQALLDAHSRWRIIHLQPCHDGTIRRDEILALSSIPRGGFLALEKVDIRVRPEMGPADSAAEYWSQSQLEWIFKPAPLLREFALHLPVHLPATPPDVPWEQLLRLELTLPDPDVCLQALVACSARLERASIRTRQWEQATIRTGPPTTLPRLHTLDLRVQISTRGEHLGPFLRSLRAPALDDLSLLLPITPGNQWEITSILDPIQHFLNEAANITKLTTRTAIDVEELPFVLALTPCLTKLTFNDPQTVVVDAFFETLAALAGQGHRAAPRHAPPKQPRRGIQRTIA